jgi:hypothetical protein
MGKLNILVLHSLGNPKLAPRFLAKHVFSLQENFPEHNYLYHDAALAIPEYVKQTRFDAILLDVTFLCARWAGGAYFKKRLADYAFVANSDAVKVAFPQDEYDCHQLLDDWMCDWKVDVVFSVIASGWDVLYPRYHLVGDIRLGYTGYIDETLLNWAPKALEDRPIDIGYRARKLPPYFGRLGENKWTIGRDVAARGRDARLRVDIELGDQGTLLGNAWLNFIGNSKFTLGANSGSSLLDPTGSIQRSVRSYLASHRDASFEEVEKNCFPALDGKYSFTAISPRVLEAALLGSAQILVDGEYSGIVKPGEHFIPIRRDASNFPEVLDAMADRPLVEGMIRRCREAVLSVDALRYKNKARMILNLVREMTAHKRPGSNGDKVRQVIARYASEMQPKYQSCWRRQNYRARLVKALAPYPRLHQMLRSAKQYLG